VLLELVAGRPANLRDPENTSIIHWARQRLAQGNIEAVVDPRMGGNHDINSVWKVANIALSCTAEASAERPTMTDVVAELQECLELEKGHASGDDTSGHFYSANGSDRPQDNDHSTDVSRSSTTFEVEVERNFGRVPTMPTGPAVR
jgi:hypothetical protein